MKEFVFRFDNDLNKHVLEFSESLSNCKKIESIPQDLNFDLKIDRYVYMFNAWVGYDIQTLKNIINVAANYPQISFEFIIFSSEKEIAKYIKYERKIMSPVHILISKFARFYHFGPIIKDKGIKDIINTTFNLKV